MRNILAQLGRLPLPFRIGLAVIGVIGIIWLSQWLGGLSIVLAAGCWGLTLAGVLYASDRLPMVERLPAARRMFEQFAPKHAYAAAPPVSIRSMAGGAPAPAQSPPPAPAFVIPDVTRFSGLDRIWEGIHRVIESRAIATSTVQPATILFLLGPRGTGKSSVSLALAKELTLKQVVKSDRIVRISEEELPGLGYSYGPTDEALKDAERRFTASMDGVLVIDTIDQLVSGEAGSGLLMGPLLLNAARRAPGRLFVIATGSERALTVLDPKRRWLNQFNVQSINFDHLDADALREIFLNIMSDRGLQLMPEANKSLATKIAEFLRLPKDGPDAFDNAHAVRRLVDAVLINRGLRMRSTTDPMAQVALITDKDIRDANPMN